MGSKCKMLFSRPPKGTSLRETTSLTYLLIWRIDRKNWCWAVGWQKNEKLAESLDTHFRILGGCERGLSYRDEMLHRDRGPRRNHPCKFRRRLVRGFLRERVRIFPLFHWLALSSLKQCHSVITSVAYTCAHGLPCHSSVGRSVLMQLETRCSAIAETPRCRVRYGFRQK